MKTNLEYDNDGIYTYGFTNVAQKDEIKLREIVARDNYTDYIKNIGHHHSIPVMDREITEFLKHIPENGTIIDVGGCWGWHWRKIKNYRNDVTVVIVDFLKSNLLHAKKLLGNQINKNIFLVHGDATQLVFEDNVFDGYWSVQTLQHIPNYKKAVKEAWRILRPGGEYVNYSLNKQILVKCIYKIIGKYYHVNGNIPGSFFLARANDEQLNITNSIFSSHCRVRYSEILFSPELKIKFPGKHKSILGKIDSLMSINLPIFFWIARQQSYHNTKLSNKDINH